jgi:ABC-2 type transport system ATP-binding protein
MQRAARIRMVEAMLDLLNVSRRFGDVTALDDVTLSVAAQRCVGFVGRNGAGKTTTMRVALGLVEADAGEVRWQGRSITAGDRLRIGYMPEERGLYPAMSAHDQLVLLGRLAGMSRRDAGDAAVSWLERLGLVGRAGESVEQLSLGNQQRVQLAAALVHDPEVLILDEPFSGLDPIGVDTLADVLRERIDAGVGVLFSSHQLDLVERLCDDVVIIEAGRVVHADRVAGGGALTERFRELVTP